MILLKPYLNKMLSRTSFFSLKKCLMLIISPLLLINKKCASYFCRETINEINSLKKQEHVYLIHSWINKGYSSKSDIDVFAWRVTWNYSYIPFKLNWQPLHYWKRILENFPNTRAFGNFLSYHGFWGFLNIRSNFVIFDNSCYLELLIALRKISASLLELLVSKKDLFKIDKLINTFFLK